MYRRDLEILRMTLKNDTAPFLCHFNLRASFCSHRSIQIGVTVRKLPILVKISALLSCVTLDDLKNNRAPHLCYFKLHASCRSQRSIQSGVTVWKPPIRVKICFDFCDLDLWPLTFCMDITFINGDNSCKLHDDVMTGTLWQRDHKWTDIQTDVQTDGRADISGVRAVSSQLKIHPCIHVCLFPRFKTLAIPMFMKRRQTLFKCLS